MQLIQPISKPRGSFYQPAERVDIAQSTYTLLSTDAGKILVFALPCAVTVNAGVLATSEKVILINESAGDLSITSALSLVKEAGTDAICTGIHTHLILTQIDTTHSGLEGDLVASAPSLTSLIEDTFTGANGAAINGRTPDTVSPGNNWVLREGSMAISATNTLMHTAADFASSIATLNYSSSATSLRLSVDFATLAAAGSKTVGDGFLLWGYSAVNTYLCVAYNLQASGQIKIRQFSSGSATDLATYNAEADLDYDTFFNIEADINTTATIVKLNGVQVINYVADLLTSRPKTIGLRTRRANVRADNFKLLEV